MVPLSSIKPKQLRLRSFSPQKTWPNMPLMLHCLSPFLHPSEKENEEETSFFDSLSSASTPIPAALQLFFFKKFISLMNHEWYSVNISSLEKGKEKGKRTKEERVKTCHSFLTSFTTLIMFPELLICWIASWTFWNYCFI